MKISSRLKEKGDLETEIRVGKKVSGSQSMR